MNRTSPCRCPCLSDVLRREGRSYLPIKPLYIEEVMRFIYVLRILGILLLIAIGFLVYFYRDCLFGTIDGFNTGGASGVMFQLYEQRCTLADYSNKLDSCWVKWLYSSQYDNLVPASCNTNGYNRDVPQFIDDYSAFYPTVPKSLGVELCRSLGGRMATYNELASEVKAGRFKIDEKIPAMVADSDKTYRDSNNTLIISDSNKGYDLHNQRICKRVYYKINRSPGAASQGNITTYKPLTPNFNFFNDYGYTDSSLVGSCILSDDINSFNKIKNNS